MRLRSLLLVALLAAPSGAQSGGTVSGVVRDSIARTPLVGAIVQLVSADPLVGAARTTSSDSSGRFVLGDVPEGRYRLGFFHPMLDSLGLEPILREVRLEGSQAIVADLGIPSPARLAGVLCGVSTERQAEAVVIGTVRRTSDGEGIESVTVVAEWIEPSASPEALAYRAPGRTATTAANGWFAICRMPRSGRIALVATRGADSSERVEVEVPTHGLLRRELYLVDDVRRSDPRAPRRAMLDTVKVTAERTREANASGFAERRRNASGRFLTPEDVVRRAPLETSDLFRQMPGIRMSARGLMMRAIGNGECVPPIYLDGHYMRDLSPGDINAWVRPDEIEGIEIYGSGMSPLQFQPGLGGCGSIVIWTKPREDVASTSSWKGRLARALGVTAIGVAIGLILIR